MRPTYFWSPHSLAHSRRSGAPLADPLTPLSRATRTPVKHHHGLPSVPWPSSSSCRDCCPSELRLLVSNPRHPLVHSFPLCFSRTMLTCLFAPQQLCRRRPKTPPCLSRRSRVPKSSLEVTNLTHPYFLLVCPRLCAITRRSRVEPLPSRLAMNCHPPAPLCLWCSHGRVHHTSPNLPNPFPTPRVPRAPTPSSLADPRRGRERRHCWRSGSLAHARRWISGVPGLIRSSLIPTVRSGSSRSNSSLTRTPTIGPGLSVLLTLGRFLLCPTYQPRSLARARALTCRSNLGRWSAI
jgi:hypothetical protein